MDNTNDNTTYRQKTIYLNERSIKNGHLLKSSYNNAHIEATKVELKYNENLI